MLVIFAGSRIGLFKPYLGVVAAVLFLYIPIISLFIQKQQPSVYGIGSKGLLKSVLRAVLLSIIIFPIYAAGFYFFMKHFYNLQVAFSTAGQALKLPLLIFALNDLLMVAVPEEVFYRGYLQSELGRCDKQKISIFGVKAGASVLIVNAMFAAGHLIIIPDISRLAVFFPGLLFSWLREKDDNIAGSITFHWLSNVLSFVLFSIIR